MVGRGASHPEGQVPDGLGADRPATNRPAADRNEVEPAEKSAARLARRIEREVVDAGWPVGAVLGREADLVARHGVSRGVLREAVRILEHRQVARMRPGPGGGLVVTAPDASSAADALAIYLEWQDVSSEQIVEARRTLELACVELAAARGADPEVAARLRAVLAEEEQHGRRGFVRHTHDVHLAVAAATGNPALLEFTRILAMLTSRRAEPPGPRLDVAVRDVHRAHAGIVDAVLARDPVLARRRMDRHLRAVAAWLGDESVS